MKLINKFLLFTCVVLNLTMAYTQDVTQDIVYEIKGQKYCQEYVSNVNNESCFFCLELDRVDGINQLKDLIAKNDQVCALALNVIFNILIDGHYDFVPSEIREDIKDDFLFFLSLQDDEMKLCIFNDIKEKYLNLVFKYLDYIQNNPIFLSVNDNTKDKHASILGLIALANNYSLEIYVQNCVLEDGSVDPVHLSLFHSFNPFEYGIRGYYQLKKIVFTSDDRKIITKEEINTNWRNHYNILTLVQSNLHEDPFSDIWRNVQDFEKLPDPKFLKTESFTLPKTHEKELEQDPLIDFLASDDLPVQMPLEGDDFLPRPPFSRFQNSPVQKTSKVLSKFSVTYTTRMQNDFAAERNLQNSPRQSCLPWLQLGQIDREYSINGVVYLEKKMSGYSNQCGFFSFGTNRIEGMTKVKLLIESNEIARKLLIDEIYRKLVGLDFGYLHLSSLQKFSIEQDLENYFASLGTEEYNEQHIKIMQKSESFIDTYLNHFTNTCAMLEVERDCGEENVSVMDLLAFTCGFGLEVYVQEQVNEDGYIDVSKLTLFHSFDPKRWGFEGEFQVKKLVLTNYSQSKVKGDSTNWRNHYNVLELKKGG